MKKIKYIKTFAAAAAALLAFSCTDITADIDEVKPVTPAEEQSEKAGSVLKINVSEFTDYTDNKKARTVIPQVTLSDLTDFTLSGYRPGYGDQQLGKFENAEALSSAEIIIPYEYVGETWSFTLSANKGNSRFKAEAQDVELKNAKDDGTTTLNFVLTLYDWADGTGNFAFTIDYSEDPCADVVTGAEAVFKNIYDSSYNIEEQTFTEDDLTLKKFTLSGENVIPSIYNVKITLYHDETVAGYWQDDIYIRPDLTSSKTQKISLKKFIKITYELNAADDESLVFNGEEFIRKSAKLSVPSRSEYVFAGWFADEEFETPFDASKVSGTSATVYAKWAQKNFTVSADNAASTLSTAEGGSVEDPVTVKITGAYSDELISEIKTALNANTKLCVSLDLSELTGATTFPTEAFYNCTNLVGIVLPSTLTEISDGMLRSTSIKQITIPDSVTKIGTCAFCACQNLSQVIFGENSVLTELEVQAFRACPFTQIELPESLTTIKTEAFRETNLTSITIPSNVTALGDYTFCDCKDLESVTFEENSSLTTIDQYTFQSCYKLEQIELPESLVKIDQYAFTNSGLKQIEIPASVQELDCSFYGAGNLESVTFAENSQLTKIGSFCFYSTPELTSITIPDSVTTIGYGAFQSSAISSITLGSGITEIESEAFRSTSKLTSITIPSGVNKIESYVFMESGITSINMSSGITVIDSYAFYNSQLASVTIPSTVTEIGAYAFCGTKITSVNIPDSVTKIGSQAFISCEKLTSVTIGKGITQIGIQAFTDCPLETFTIDPEASIQLENGILYDSQKTQIILINDTEITSLSVPATIEQLPITEIAALERLETITVAEDNTVYSSNNGLLYTKDGSELLVYPLANKNTTLELSASVTKIPSLPDTLTAINVSEDNTVYSSDSGVLLSKDKTKIILCPSAKEGSYTIPASVNLIDLFAFSGTSLTSLSLENEDIDIRANIWAEGIDILKDSNKFKADVSLLEFIKTNSSGGYYIYLVDEEEILASVSIPSASVYESECLDAGDTSFTIVHNTENKIYLWYKVPTEAGKTYNVTWLDGYNQNQGAFVNQPDDLRDCYIYIYDSDFAKICDKDDDITISFTATGSVTYIVPQYRTGSTDGSCGFRVWKASE